MALRVESRTSAWPPGPERPTLRRAAVHLWRGFFERLASNARGLRDVLATDELERADRYHFARDRERFIVSRGLLRVLLGRYVRCEARQLRLVDGPGGKPEVAGLPSPGAVRFNVSHSDGLVLYAFALDRQVGVDVERVRPAVAADSVAEMFFAPPEVAALRALPAPLQPAAFFDAWTRKEAYLKATGNGLTDGLDALRVDGSHDEIGRWTVRPFHAAPGYAAALVVEGHDWELRRYDVKGVLG